MLEYPQIDPVIFAIGPVKLHWYGMMYLIGFLFAWWLGWYRAKTRPDAVIKPEQMGDLIFYGALGVVLGGRIGYVLFYKPMEFIANPLEILQVWQGGMAFHGGLLGVIIAMWLYSRGIKRSFFELTDFIAPLVPLGLAAGRLGNFINGELWGRPTDVAWGMVFPHVDDLARHPSQLYQAGLEGIMLFVILWLYSSKPRPTMAVSGLFLLGYGFFRSVAEFFREPDAHLGFIAWDWLTMGQILSVPMMVIGGIFIFVAYRRSRPQVE